VEAKNQSFVAGGAPGAMARWVAYAVTVRRQAKAMVEARYRLTVEGEVIEENGTKCYVVNSGMSAKGLTMDKDSSVTAACWMCSCSTGPVTHRRRGRAFPARQPAQVGLHCWRGREITVESDPDRPV